MQLTWIFGLLCLNIGGTYGYFSHEGKYSHRLSDGHLIVPRKVDHNGQHLSHNVTHHCNDVEETLHYRIDVNNDTSMHIELQPTNEFIAPMMVIERHRRDLRTRKRHPKNNSHCHYQGHIRDDHHSKVALSACDGLAGFIRSSKGDYFIEPSKHHSATPDGHRHVLFQRSAAVKQKQQQQNKKKKKRRKGRKKHVASNCGTKEPKGPRETQIEWQPQGKVIVQGGRKTRGHHLNNVHRAKRSISSPRHVEALVVADSSMVAFHQDGYIETYLLTIMNMVSSLYKDPAIGNLIKIVVVRIVLLEEDETHPDFNVTHIAESNLQNFCRWQRLENPKNENDPHHHDVAILITRKDICSASGCTTLGVANVGGMCRPDRSCSVNEDNGITLAHTITHELGHNFGMYHDTEKTGCDGRTGKIVHVMTPSFEADTVQVSWSNCSRRDITHFLDQGLGKCLDDPPTDEEFIYPDLPPGAMYNADLQCRLQFNQTNDSIQVCSKLDEICSQLWCLVNDVCVTQLRPAAPGTNCGKHKWCQHQQCVPIEELPNPVDGGWGNWNEWSKCSRSCGGGISMQSRQCDHPTPANGGSFCVGERIRYKICNQELCPEDEPSFRSQQCAMYNNETFKGKQYKWQAYFDSHDPCELYCTDSEDTVIVPWGDSAADGTPCNIGTNDMCIAGICKKVGCDWVVDSNTTEDQCGVCGGTGETCTTIKGEFNKKLNISDGYYEITTIPTGSRHILIEEISPSKNFISIGKAGSNETYLNGDRIVSMSGEFMIAKAMGLYERDNEQEKLKIPGPIKHEITVNILVRGKKNGGIKYEYTLSANSTLVPVYYWQLGEWAACSATCGGGKQRRLPICIQDNKGVVDEENCWSNAEGTRPTEKTRHCNEDPCPCHWWVGPWQLCPVTCKKHGQPEPLKRRSIMCVDQNEMALPDTRCTNETKPHDTDACGANLPYCNSDDNNSESNMI
ncbi:hypothetical protein HA402_006678 [Bradysia odoriphaga]|nr:hypothetical protein HA402_006678 [Bradysia odoriphaga]